MSEGGIAGGERGKGGASGVTVSEEVFYISIVQLRIAIEGLVQNRSGIIVTNYDAGVLVSKHDIVPAGIDTWNSENSVGQMRNDGSVTEDGTEVDVVSRGGLGAVAEGHTAGYSPSLDFSIGDDLNNAWRGATEVGATIHKDTTGR